MIQRLLHPENKNTIKVRLDLLDPENTITNTG
jgi:hypothetical protein